MDIILEVFVLVPDFISIIGEAILEKNFRSDNGRV